MEIIERKVEFTTPWFQLVSKRVAGESAPYYALAMQDYVSVVAFTEQDQLLVVRQYRPAVERHTLELPSGHVEKNETPEKSARRELAEECGFEARELELLGKLISDTGRNENRLWCYLAREVAPIPAGYVPESAVETILVPRGKIAEVLNHADFDHALHLGALLLAVARHGPQLLALK